MMLFQFDGFTRGTWLSTYVSVSSLIKHLVRPITVPFIEVLSYTSITTPERSPVQRNHAKSIQPTHLGLAQKLERLGRRLPSIKLPWTTQSTAIF